MDDSDPLLSELCSICHVNPPKYRCPRCSTRTCSLPCTRRHKLWSQCSGVRDPAAYLKRSELATESAFDRDFNFISGIERSLERADRDAENRGIELPRGSAADGDAEESPEAGAGRKRKHPGQGLVKGEAGFLRGAEAGAVKVMRAPRGMTRNKQNTSRWHPKHKCLSWTVEWIPTSGEKLVCNSLETRTLAQAYDGVYPLPKEERPGWALNREAKGEQQSNTATAHGQTDTATSKAAAATTESTKTKPEEQPPPESAETSINPAEEKTSNSPIIPHRGLYFYLHRPRTTTKKPVLVPLPPHTTLANALRERTVLEFPTIYILPDSAETLVANQDTSQFIVEEEYLRTAAPEETAESENEGTEMDNDAGLPGSADIENVDEQKVLEVLKRDLFEPVAEEQE